MRNKKLYKMAAMAALTGIMTAGFKMTSLAVGWQQDLTGRWYGTNEDNTEWYKDGWQWIDDDNDGYDQCYYFDPNGYVLVNTTAPDGSRVNEDGAWISDGYVQKRPTKAHNIKAADIDTDFADETYNEWGVNRTAIDMVCQTREDNAKYGEVSVTFPYGADYTDCIAVAYQNGFQVIYNGTGGIYQSLILDKGRTDLEWSLLLKFYFPNHQAYKDRVMDSQEKEDLLNELGFDVAGSLDSVNFVFKDNDRLLSMDWYCTDRLVLMDVSRLLDSSNPRYTKYK